MREPGTHSPRLFLACPASKLSAHVGSTPETPRIWPLLGVPLPRPSPRGTDGEPCAESHVPSLCWSALQLPPPEPLLPGPCTRWPHGNWAAGGCPLLAWPIRPHRTVEAPRGVLALQTPAAWDPEWLHGALAVRARVCLLQPELPERAGRQSSPHPPSPASASQS